jgi:hypothetical protein
MNNAHIDTMHKNVAFCLAAIIAMISIKTIDGGSK